MRKRSLACAIAALTVFTATASAHDKVKLAIGQRGNWDTSVSEIGQLAGIFGKHELELEIIYTNGAGETQQALQLVRSDVGRDTMERIRIVISQMEGAERARSGLGHRNRSRLGGKRVVGVELRS